MRFSIEWYISFLRSKDCSGHCRNRSLSWIYGRRDIFFRILVHLFSRLNRHCEDWCSAASGLHYCILLSVSLPDILPVPSKHAERTSKRVQFRSHRFDLAVNSLFEKWFRPVSLSKRRMPCAKWSVTKRIYKVIQWFYKLPAIKSGLSGCFCPSRCLTSGPFGPQYQLSLTC